MSRNLHLRSVCFWLFSGVLAAISRPSAAQVASTPDTLRFSDFILAAEVHPLVRAAQSRVDAARGSRISAGALPNPVLSYEEQGGAEAIPKERMTSAMFSLAPIWQWSPLVRRANEDLRAAAYDAERTARVVVADAVRAYLEAGVAQVSVDLAREAEASLDTVVEFNRARVSEGVTAEADLIRVQLERDRASADRAIGEAEAGRAHANLLAFFPAWEATSNVAVETPSRVASALLRSELPPLADLLTQSVERRADLNAARARARSARAGVAVERSMLVRDVSLMAGTMAMEGERAPMLGLSLPLPLLDQNRGGVRRASAEATTAEHELTWLAQQARGDILARHHAAEALQTLLRELSSVLLSRADESVRIAIAAYREGAVSVLHVLDATRAARDARLTYERATAEWVITLTELYLAAGVDPAQLIGAGK